MAPGVWGERGIAVSVGGVSLGSEGRRGRTNNTRTRIEMQRQLTQGRRRRKYKRRARLGRVVVVQKVQHIEHEPLQRCERAMREEPRAEGHEDLAGARDAGCAGRGRVRRAWEDAPACGLGVHDEGCDSVSAGQSSRRVVQRGRARGGR